MALLQLTKAFNHLLLRGKQGFLFLLKFYFKLLDHFRLHVGLRLLFDQLDISHLGRLIFL